MSFWWWVLIFVGIAAIGSAVYALLGLQLWRKFRRLTAEIGRLTQMVSELQVAVATASAPRPDEGLDTALTGRH